ncbi:U4/U6-U5 snRNP complex subunit lsm6 [Malassezia yamatoensis]|uniref:U6 snRNA-associated Sm-like protein LSm6 n=1 Tax=Malassezia yamatoensis TaxID=253288 RepID=A0AAJ5Z0Z6_9BASI|nr:U4/U6-U5 snRNP complex subunit lsm6 [Malassezia yamatoensis]
MSEEGKAAAVNQDSSPVEENEPSVKAGSPNDFLKGVTGKRVAVRLNSGIDYLGTLSCLDGYMNIAMEDTTEYVDGNVKSSLGDAFIRGNNGTLTWFVRLTVVLYITALDEIDTQA